MVTQRVVTRPTPKILTNCCATVSTTRAGHNVTDAVRVTSKRNGNQSRQTSISCAKRATATTMLRIVNMTQKLTEKENHWTFMEDTQEVVSAKTASILLKGSTVRDVEQDTTMMHLFR